MTPRTAHAAGRAARKTHATRRKPAGGRDRGGPLCCPVVATRAPSQLPIDEVLGDIVAALQRSPCAVVEAPPGAGKTTRVPLALLQAGLAGGREILVLQPRRLAARMTAARVAESLGEPLGATVGYQVRFESAVGPETRLRFITEGLLGRKLHADPQLRDVGVVVLDEFHERHIDGDLGLALLRALQRGARPDLKIVVMSATLDGAAVAAYLSEGAATECARITSAGRMFPVAIEHLGEPNELHSGVLRALAKLVDEGLDGDVLVFLPGAREIARAAETCAGFAAHHGLQVFPLHGELPPAEQDLAVRPCPQRKLILSTNVAETSVTIDGIAAVIDGGLARVAAHDPWTGIPTLQLGKISRASAAQRAGRAGRTRPGRCLRLYAQHDHDRRPEHTPPEIHRVDLAGALLDLHAFGVAEPAAFAWFEAPPAAALQAGEALLRRLGAIDPAGRVTPLGRRMLAFPLHPRLGRLMCEGVDRGVPGLACGAAALLSERSIRPAGALASCDADADVLVDLADLEKLRRRGDERGLLPGPARRALQVRDQLLRALPHDSRDRSKELGIKEQEREDRLRMALLAAFPERVAQAREDVGGFRALALAGGGAARLGPGSVVRTAPWLLALEVEQRREADRGAQVLVRSACAIEPEWLIDQLCDEIEERDELQWNAARERVEGARELRYMGLLLERTTGAKLPPAASELLRTQALAAGPERFVGDPEALRGLMARSAFVAAHVPGAPVITEAVAREVLAELCEGRTSFAELRAADLYGQLLARVAGGGGLERLAPTHVQLPGGRRAAVHYEPDKPPWLASRLQDFFGMSRGPHIAGGKVPLVLHLLAPNGRAEQVTTDLAGFWDRHYPEVRKALMRRYPRHSWPEDPRTAAPPAPRR
ncbi:ATP-dependent helicase HrpB [Nannocystis exedens]|uniref:ATP-dependent helicase HrpB n=1 Tax=Nannocystis exedens TaxID=54 RepID=A0A1I1Y5R0_9BACT|nr:ATP-dependent helicase [Nannocystis exedens]SFE13170.1 ATP-dependent helicase HrpB [Nannocystis exedens]